MAPSDILARDVAVGSGENGVSPADAAAAWLAGRERTLWALAAFALVADVVTTVAGLHAGLAEGNPVIAATLADVGVAGFLAIKGTVLLGAFACRLAVPRFRVAIPLGVALPWLAAAGTNAVLLLLAIA